MKCFPKESLVDPWGGASGGGRQQVHAEEARLLVEGGVGLGHDRVEAVPGVDDLRPLDDVEDDAGGARLLGERVRVAVLQRICIARCRFCFFVLRHLNLGAPPTARARVALARGAQGGNLKMGSWQMVLWQPRWVHAEMDALCYQKITADERPIGREKRIEFKHVKEIEELEFGEFVLQCDKRDFTFGFPSSASSHVPAPPAPDASF